MTLLTAYPNISGGSPGSFTNVTVTSSTIPTNGLYLPAANTVGIATNGTLRVSVSTTALSSSLNTIIGSTSVAPDGTLHVHTATAGTVTANGSADEIVAENSGDGGISVLVPNLNVGSLFFGNPASSRGASLEWAYTSDVFLLSTYKVGAVTRFGAGNGVTNLTLSGASGAQVANFAGSIQAPSTITAALTTGNQTINKMAGSVNFAAAATTLTVTNSLVSANSVIIATIGTNDATMTSVNAVVGSGSFVLNANAAATAETRVNFLVINKGD